jgi:hypothetical protein
MASNGVATRQRLFELYSRQLELGGVTPIGIFICPLCGDGYTQDALNGPNPTVSLAHVVPAALGGKLVTLACTRCNNGNGARLEAELIHHFGYQDWSKGVGTRNARLSGEFGNIGVEFKRSPDNSNWALYFVAAQTNPAHLTAFEEWSRKHAENPDAEITWRISWTARKRPTEVGAAIYQSAYLLMFAYFGYDFVFPSPFGKLREHIVRPKEISWPGHINDLIPNSVSAILGQRDAAVMFVREPIPCLSAILRFRPRDGEERTLGVLLPPPETDEEQIPTIEQGKLNGVSVPYRPEILSTRPHYFAGLWKHVQAANAPPATPESANDDGET